MAIADKLKEMGVDHLHYMAPLGTAKLIAVFGIQSYNELQSARKKPPYSDLIESIGTKSIADPSVQFRRDRITIDGKSLHDYVPLYFGVHTPMQYVVTRNNINTQDTVITFVEIDTAMVFRNRGVLYTDGNAASTDTIVFRDESGIDQIDWNIVLHTNNCFSKEYKRVKCAEVLVPNCVDTKCIKGFVFKTERAKNQFEDWIADCIKGNFIRQTPETRCDISHFYTDDMRPYAHIYSPSLKPQAHKCESSTRPRALGRTSVREWKDGRSPKVFGRR